MKRHTPTNLFEKNILIILLLHICIWSNAQKAYNFNGEPAKNTLKTEITKVVLTGDDMFDARLKSAFNNYWNVSKFEFITSDQYGKMEEGKDYKTVFMYGDFDVKSYGLSFSKFLLMVNVKKNTTYKMIDLPFDNMTETKSGETSGADRAKDAVLNKIEPYIMLMNAQLKKQIELGNMKYDGYKGNKDLIKTKRVFIQEEYFLNNLDQTLLQNLNFKVDILNSKQISTLFTDKANRDKSAWLCFVTSPIEISAFIIDLKTGELLNYASIEKVETPKKQLNEKSFNKLIKMLNKE